MRWIHYHVSLSIKFRLHGTWPAISRNEQIVKATNIPFPFVYFVHPSVRGLAGMEVVSKEPGMERDVIGTPRKSRLPRTTAKRKPTESIHASPASDPTTSGSYVALAHHKSSELPSRRRTADPETIQKVEAIVDQIQHSLQRQDDSISIALRTRNRSKNPPSAQQPQSSSNHYKLTFPGNTPKEAWRFSTAQLVETVCRRTSSMLTCSPAVVLRILDLIHDALVDNVVVSKRCGNERAS